MMKVFEFLYYCLYRMFALIKRVGEKDENLASLFYSVLLSTKSLTLFFIIRYTDARALFLLSPYNNILKVSMAAVFFIWYFACKSYFLKRGNYIKIIAFYEKKYAGKNQRMAIVGIIYSICTFILFMIILNFPVS